MIFELMGTFILAAIILITGYLTARDLRSATKQVNEMKESLNTIVKSLEDAEKQVKDSQSK